MIQRITTFILLVLGLFVSKAQAAADVTTYSLTDENAPWHPTRIQQDARGMLWIGSWNGLYRFDGYHFQSFKPEPGQGIDIDNDRVRDILLAGGDSLLCRVDERVYAFDVVKCRFYTLPEELQEQYYQRMMQAAHPVSHAQPLIVEGLSFTDINQHFIDLQGGHWLLGTDRIYCVRPDQRHGRSIDDATTQDVTRCLYQDSQGCYWLSSRDNQQVVVYDSHWQRVGYLGQDGALHQQPTAFAPIYCMHDDGKGTLWLGSKPDGMYRLHRKKDGFNVERIPYSTQGDGLPTRSVYDIQSDSLGSLWLASWDDGIICIDNPQESQPSYLHCLRLTDACSAFPADAMKARHIYIRPDGTLLATTTRGLLIIDNIYTSLSQMTMRLHRRESDRRNSLTSSAVMAITFDQKDRLYVATESGGVCLAEGDDIHAEQIDFRHLTATEGLTSDVSYLFVSAPDGRILVLCPNGVSAINADNNTIESYGPQFWSTSAPFTECQPQISGDTLLILAHDEGIISLPLRELSQQGFAPYIALTSAIIGTDLVQYDVDCCDTLRLNDTQRSLVLSYAALDLRSNRSLRYRTRLTPEGEEPRPWSRAADTHEISLQDLQPGTYQLQICSSNADGQWTDNLRTVTIIVQPRFFQSWYGQLLLWVLFAIAIAVGTSTLIYIRRLDNKRHELLQSYLTLLESTTQAQIAAASQQNAAGEEAESPQANEEAKPRPTVPEAHSLTPSEQQFMDRLMNYVEQNISNCDASLTDMATATGTSKSSLTRKTHQLLGVTPADFFKEARIKHACKLLTSTSSTLAEIALACGFSDPKYFSKCFKASTGKTPTEYRS